MWGCRRSLKPGEAGAPTWHLQGVLFPLLQGPVPDGRVDGSSVCYAAQEPHPPRDR